MHFTIKINYFGHNRLLKNYLFIMKSIRKIIIHALEPIQEKFECFTSKPTAHETF